MVRSNNNYEHDKVFNNKLKRLKRRKRKVYEEVEYGRKRVSIEIGR